MNQIYVTTERRRFLKPFDASGVFCSPVSEGSMRRAAIRSAGATVLSSGLSLAVQILATVLLARLLMPRDFGVVTMVTTFSLLLVNFGLNGFTEAILQSKEMNDVLASNLFWISTGAGLILTIAFAALGSSLAQLLHDPLVANVAVSMSATIFLTSTSVLHLALLKRAMRFATTGAIDLSSRGMSIVVSAVLAWEGWGYRALVAGAITEALTQSIGAWLMCRWIPGLPRRRGGTISLIRFAAGVYARFVLNYLTRNMDNFLVGWRFGARSLGFYKKAYDLFALSAGQLTSPLTNVAVSGMSRVEPRSSEYRSILIKSISVMALVGMALAGDLTLVGKDLIRFLLGTAWDPAGQVFTFFGPGIGVMIVYHINGWIHLSIGRADRWFRWGLIEIAVTSLLFLLGLPWGAKGVAAAWTVSFWILTIPAFWYAGRPIGLRITPLFAPFWKYVAAALVSVSACAGILQVSSPLIGEWSGSAGALARVVTISALFGFLYCGAVVLIYRGFAPLRESIKILREMVSPIRFSQSSPDVAPECDTVSPCPLVPQEVSTKPLVSILIPAFNAQAFIADTLRSALAQTWEPKEILVVDDGSSDQTLAIARRFESRGIRVVAQDNLGAAAARNKAFSLSRGQYIQWLDADDLLAPDKIARQMAIVDKCPGKRYVLSCAFGRFKYRWNRARFTPTALWCDQSPAEWMTRKLGENAYMQTATWLVSRELTEEAGPWDTRLLGDDDGEYFSRVLLLSDGIRFVPEARVYYRSPWVGTLSYVGSSTRKIEAHWLAMQLQIGYLRAMEESERVKRACLNYLQNCFIYFYPERTEIVMQAQDLAKRLGGHLDEPYLSWKYSWARTVFGWKFAKDLQLMLPRIKWKLTQSWDHFAFTVSKFAEALQSGRDLGGADQPGQDELNPQTSADLG